MRNFQGLNLVFAFLGGLMLLFIIAPVAGLFISSSSESMINTISDDETVRSIGLTLWAAMAATFLSAFFAVPLAYLLARKKFRGHSLIMGIINLPIVIPHTAAGIALLGIVAANSTSGKFFKYIGLDFVGNPAGILIAMAFVSVPFLIIAARDAFYNVPVKLEKAALTLGASPLRMFFTISLPLAWRGILSGLVMMFARGMSEFGAVVIIAYHPMITPVLIFEKFSSFGLEHSRPIAAVFMLVTLSVFVLLRIITNKKQNAER